MAGEKIVAAKPAEKVKSVKAKAKHNIAFDGPPPAFDGFSKEAFKFLVGLKKNNNKEWFDAHRADYEKHLKLPSQDFVLAMEAALADRDLPFIASIKRSLFRIYRDIRFSKDKTPYKTHIGFVFPLEGTPKGEWSGLYLAMEPGEGKGVTIKSYFGGGIYMPESEHLKKIRAKIADDHDTLRKLLKEKKFAATFPGGITGESLTRMPKGYDEDHPAADWLKMKSFTFSSPVTEEELMSPKLVELLVKKMEAARAVEEWLGRM